MCGVELLKNLVHDGVGEVGDHGQLHFSAGGGVGGVDERKSIPC